MTQTRKHDPQTFEMSPNEFAEIVRNGGNSKPRFDWQGWIKVSLAILLPGVALISYISGIEGDVSTVKKDVDRHETWIQTHTADTADIRGTIHELDSKQGIILEKITRAQKDIEELVRRKEN